jgi:nicotinamidase-related amidase
MTRASNQFNFILRTNHPMTISSELTRSPMLMSRHDTAVLVVDVQSKLHHLIPSHKTITFNIARLIDGAKLFEMPVVGTEQYPQGLGGTEPELADRIGEMPDKTRFSCLECRTLFEGLASEDRRKILVIGIETHVCIQQTVIDLLNERFGVYVAVDAVGARHAIDHEMALRRMESAGATLTTTESALFEWCEHSKDEQFKAISALIQKTPVT